MVQNHPNRRSKKNIIKDVFGMSFFVLCVIGGACILYRAEKEQSRYDDFVVKYYEPAVQDADAHRYREAAQKLQVQLKEYPDDYDANFEMGVVLMGLNNNKEARIHFVTAQNHFLGHHNRFSDWEPYDAAQRKINQIDRAARSFSGKEPIR